MTGRSAYTMVEVVMVMLVMGILAAVAAPRYSSSTASFRVEAAAKRIVADLNYVRLRARMTGNASEGWVSFFPSLEKYRLTAVPDPDHPSNEYWIDFAKTAYPVDLVSATFTNVLGVTSAEALKYDLYGFPKSGTSPIAALASGQIVVASGGQQRTVVIDPVTGKASVQ